MVVPQVVVMAAPTLRSVVSVEIQSSDLWPGARGMASWLCDAVLVKIGSKGPRAMSTSALRCLSAAFAVWMAGCIRRAVRTASRMETGAPADVDSLAVVSDVGGTS